MFKRRRRRARQEKVPDFNFLLNTPDGMAESDQCGTIEYMSVFCGYNVRFHGAAPMVRGQPEAVPGPLVTRFPVFHLIYIILNTTSSKKNCV